MTSGSFHTLPLDAIVVDREGRQRRELKGIPDLADSISRLGLIHPPVVTRDNVLVSGERRVTAMRSLGWTSCSIQYVDEIDPPTLRAIELEENIKREDIPWKDRCNAILEFNELRKASVPGWSQEKTAEALGIAPSTVTVHIQVAKELAKGNTRVVDAPKFSVARGIVDRAQQRQAATEMDAFKSTKAIPSSGEEPYPNSIIVADFNEWAPRYDGPKFNLLHCDFPYGINADTFAQGSAPAHGGYDDTPDVYWRLMDTLGNNLNRLCSESCHMIFWFSMKHYMETLYALRNMGWTCDGYPLIWLKSDNVGTLPDPERGPRRVYETAFFCARGDRKIVSAVGNGYAAPTDRTIHTTAKPEPTLRHFFRMVVDEHTRLLDPTAGSGTALRGAESLGAKCVVGLEINEEFAARAKDALERSRTKAALAGV